MDYLERRTRFWNERSRKAALMTKMICFFWLRMGLVPDPTRSVTTFQPIPFRSDPFRCRPVPSRFWPFSKFDPSKKKNRRQNRIRLWQTHAKNSCDIDYWSIGTSTKAQCQTKMSIVNLDCYFINNNYELCRTLSLLVCSTVYVSVFCPMQPHI